MALKNIYKNEDGTPRQYMLSIYDIKTQDNALNRLFTVKGVVWPVIIFLVVFVILIYCLVALTPIRTTIPGYPDQKARAEAVDNAARIDSLESIIMRWELYSENLRRIVDGRKPLRIDSLIFSRASESAAGARKLIDDGSDTVLRAMVSKEEQFDLSSRPRKLSIEGLHFFSPLKGVISQKFEPVLHPYLDITAPTGSLVLSTLDGTVIFSGWNDESGYTIAVQHSGDIISIYKHNQKLLKNTGDKVAAGSPIALVGNTGSLTTGDHLHFELWSKGEAVDPALYISF